MGEFHGPSLAETSLAEKLPCFEFNDGTLIGETVCTLLSNGPVRNIIRKSAFEGSPPAK